MHNNNALSRRQVLQRLALGAGSALGANLGLGTSALAAGDTADLEGYKALVCVFLFGGSDSFDMYVPSANADYADYAASRPATLRATRESLLSTDTELGFNPLLPRMHALFNNRQLAIVRNVGNLIAPLSRAEFLANSPLLPFGLFAHDYQQQQWQNGVPSQPATLISSGWGGRIAEQLTAANSAAALSPIVSVAGSSFWTPGSQLSPVSVHPRSGLARLRHFDAGLRSANTAREATLAQLFAAAGDHPMKRQWINSFQRAKSASTMIGDALDNSPEFSTPFNAGNRLASQLRMVARLIAARGQIGAGRQVFFVAAGGWDTHGEQAVLFPDLLRELDDGLGSFYDTLLELDIATNVTTLTASDFGRSLTANGDGTDHGWGGHYAVLGGAVNGGQLYGQMPSYQLGGADDAGEDGRILPSTSVSQYGAIAARWLGVNDAGLGTVFPDLSNFGSNWDAGLRYLG